MCSFHHLIDTAFNVVIAGFNFDPAFSERCKSLISDSISVAFDFTYNSNHSFSELVSELDVMASVTNSEFFSIFESYVNFEL